MQVSARAGERDFYLVSPRPASELIPATVSEITLRFTAGWYTQTLARNSLAFSSVPD
jgi:hypothetical protein